MTIRDAFQQVAEAAVQAGCAQLFVQVLRTMEYSISGPSEEDGLLNEDELGEVIPEHQCIVAGMFLGGFYAGTGNLLYKVPTEVAEAIRRGLDRMSNGQNAEGVSDSSLEADMDKNIDLI